MEAKISPDQVLTKIKQLKDSGESLSKKKIKNLDPDLMQSALYYFPTWEHALQNAESII